LEALVAEELKWNALSSSCLNLSLRASVSADYELKLSLNQTSLIQNGKGQIRPETSFAASGCTLDVGRQEAYLAGVQKGGTTTNGVTWILNAGRVLFNCMQELQEASKKKRGVFKPTFEAHEDEVWADALQSRENGCVEAQLSVIKVDTLKQRFGSNFTEYQKCCFTDELKHASAIDNALEQKLLEMNLLVLLALTEAITEKTDPSTQKEALRRILVTLEIRNLMDGGPPKDIDEWFDKPQIMPAVGVWYQVLWKYEGMS